MGDLGVKQGAVKSSAVVGDRGKGGGFARRHRAKSSRQRVDLVAMAHPHLCPGTLRPQPVEQQAVVGDLDKGAPELLVLAQGHAAAQFVAHRLHAVADAEHRDAEPEHGVRRPRRRPLGDRGRATRQDDRARIKVAELVLPDRKRVDFAIDPALAHAPRDQLRDLAAEIEDQDAVGHQTSSSEGLSSLSRFRSKTATKNPSVPWRAGVKNR